MYAFRVYCLARVTCKGDATIEPTARETAIDRRCRDLAAASHAHDRARRRRFAARYQRDIPTLLYWTFPESRDAVTNAGAQPESPPITRRLCRRLWRDLSTARGLPRFYRRRQARLDVLRDLYSAECRLYESQRARASAQTAMNDFLIGLAAE